MKVRLPRIWPRKLGIAFESGWFGRDPRAGAAVRHSPTTRHPWTHAASLDGHFFDAAAARPISRCLRGPSAVLVRGIIMVRKDRNNRYQQQEPLPERGPGKIEIFSQNNHIRQPHMVLGVTHVAQPIPPICLCPIFIAIIAPLIYLRLILDATCAIFKRGILEEPRIPWWKSWKVS